MTKSRFGLNSLTLHLLAMLLMLGDHAWATIVPGSQWLTNLGRIAFPIFAFLLVEGFFHTRNIKKYLLRLLLGAVISEIPFNLMMGGSLSYPYHQNVMFTFLIALLCVWGAETAKKKHPIGGIFAGAGLFLAGTLLGFVTMVDYYGFGILTVAAFYYLRGDQWWKKLLLTAAIAYLNFKLIGGMVIDVTLFGHTFEMVQQGFGTLAMLPILLYNKKQGPHNKAIQYGCYLFYPVHMLVLSLLALYVM